MGPGLRGAVQVTLAWEGEGSEGYVGHGGSHEGEAEVTIRAYCCCDDKVWGEGRRLGVKLVQKYIP